MDLKHIDIAKLCVSPANMRVKGREMSKAEGIALARDFVQRAFVARGMVADLNVHWDIGADGNPKPHAHVVLGTRAVREDGFGAKMRDWNRTDLLEQWREDWAAHVNTRLAALDIDATVDHRSLEAQGIDLAPQHKIGPAASRMSGQGLTSERLDEHHAIARANGEKIIANPAIALDAITHGQATFTTRDLALFVHRHSEGKDQFDHVMAAMKAASQLVALGTDGRGKQRFTSRSMIATEQRLARATVTLDARRHHGVSNQHRAAALTRAAQRGMVLSSEQRSAFDHVTNARGLGVIIGYAGTGRSAMLGVAREAWEAQGYHVQSLALSGIGAENLESGSGIGSRTIASLEHRWAQDRALLIDEAGMIGTRQMERVIGEAHKSGAKVVLVGDPQQLQAIEAGAAFRSIAERHGGVEITAIRRQREDWQRDATRHLATERTGEAIAAYPNHGHVHAATTRERASAALIDRWNKDRMAHPDAIRMILTHTNDDVRALNLAARDPLRASGGLGADVTIAAERGSRSFARGDRIMLLRKERSLGVKNGTLGTIQSLTPVRMAVMLDDGRSVAFDIKDYAHVDHGYAATIHKAQGVTVDRVHVLATPGLDAHASYVALSRHRDRVDMHYGQDDFADQGKLIRTLGRERGKDMAADYALQQGPPEPARPAFSDALRNVRIRAPVTEPDMPGTAALPPPRKAISTAPDLSAAVERHARIGKALRFAQRVGDPYSVEQRTEIAESPQALERIQPNGARDLEAAFANNPSQIDEGVQGRTQAAIRAMQLEAQMRDDPALRADVFVQRWQSLERQRRVLLRDHETTRASKIADRMIGMAKSLERDPQAESILRNRRVQLGLSAPTGGGIGRDLADMIGRGRSRGLGIGM